MNPDDTLPPPSAEDTQPFTIDASLAVTTGPWFDITEFLEDADEE
jgi:hypothetical protein